VPVARPVPPTTETLRRDDSGAEKGNLWPTLGENLAMIDSSSKTGGSGTLKFTLEINAAMRTAPQNAMSPQQRWDALARDCSACCRNDSHL